MVLRLNMIRVVLEITLVTDNDGDVDVSGDSGNDDDNLRDSDTNADDDCDVACYGDADDD